MYVKALPLPLALPLLTDAVQLPMPLPLHANAIQLHLPLPLHVNIPHPRLLLHTCHVSMA